MQGTDSLRRTMAAAVVAASSLAAALSAPAWALQPTEAPAAPSLDERIAWIEAAFEEAREASHAPGAALAVIKDGEVVLLRGFGVADIQTGREVTPDTRFAVGSTTKAFTATLVGMLADENLMSLDEPVRTHLPMFRLKDPVADEQVTIRDLLCHRAGFAVMNAIWYGAPHATREELLATMIRAELLFPFREHWNYSNESFLAAGVAAGNAAGSDWDTLIETRIFAPLGMNDSNTTYDAAQADALMAQGYIWHADKSELEHQPMRPADAVGPAGSINSSVRDMARWVIFQLGRGKIDGQRLLSQEMHAETWKHHMDVDLGSLSGGYGLGWFLGEWEGRPMIEHAGGIDGFTAEVAMLPEEGVGMVMLTNQFGSPLQIQSRKIVFRGLEGDITEAAPLAEDFAPLTGNYIANFGPFKNAAMKVLVENDRLAIDVPGQMVFQLKAPDAEGKREFEITDTIAVKFNEDEHGEIYSLTFFQSGMTFEVLREGAQVPVEIDLAAAQDCLGVYRVEEQGVDVTAVIQNNRLAIDHPGQMVYELYPPDSEGWCTLRVTDTIKVRFDRDAEGKVVSITQVQNGTELVLPRVGDAGDVERLPGVDEIRAWAAEAGVIDTEGRLRSLRAEGTITAVHMGLSGPQRDVYANDGRQYSFHDFGGGRLSETWLGADTGLTRSAAVGDVEMTPKMIAIARAQSPLAWAGDWSRAFTEVSVTGKRKFDGRDVLALTGKVGEAQCTMLIDTETHLPLAFEGSIDTGIGGEIPVTVRLSDWRNVAGVKFPHRQEMEIPMAGKIVTQYSGMEANVPVKDEMFTAPANSG